MDGYSTHLPMLLRAVSLTKGPVLEIGCGSYSTLVLHEACRGRRLVSVETDKAWFSNFKRLASPGHEMLAGDSYEEFDGLIRGTEWDVVLVDHAPAARRGVDMAKLHHARLVVVHDAEQPAMYGLDLPGSRFERSFLYDKLHPWTAVMSDREDLSAFSEE